MAATTSPGAVDLGMLETIEFTVDGAVATITLRRDEHMNAYNACMLAELREALRAAEKQGDVKVVVLRGGTKAFCAGADLHEVLALRDSDDENAFATRWIAPAHELADALEASRLVVIAVIRGFALAGRRACSCLRPARCGRGCTPR